MRSLLSLLLINIILGLTLLGIHGYTPANAGQKVFGQGLKYLAQGNVGAGNPSGSGNKLPLNLLEPGDIILGGNNGSLYGTYTHAAVYAGHKQVWHGWMTAGISRTSICDALEYDRACILRVKASPDQRKAAVKAIEKRSGHLFYPLAFNNGDRIWNCTKIIWKAYREQGIELDIYHDLWLTPDQIYCSPAVSVIAESGDIDKVGCGIEKVNKTESGRSSP